jgi:hypothetical protein
MIANLLRSIFTIEIGDTPTLAFEAQNFRGARELCHEQWLKDDLAEAKADGVPLWDGKAKLRARPALPNEIALFGEAKNCGEPSDGWFTLSNWTAKPLMRSPSTPVPFRRPEPNLLIC